MRTSILGAVVLAAALATPALHHALPFAAVVVDARALEQAPANQPAQPESPPAQSQPSAQPPSEPSQRTAQPSPDQAAPQVNVEVIDRGWYANPTWIAIGAIGAVLLIVIVMMANRSGSNTVIRG